MTTSPARPDATDRVVSYLRSAAAKVREGQRLPPVRQILQDCRVSQRVLERAVQRLSAEGLVEVRARSGLYRSASPSLHRRFVEYLYFGDVSWWESSKFANLFADAFIASIAKQSTFARVHLMQRVPDQRKLIETLAASSSTKVVTHSVTESDLYLFEPLRRLGVPCLHLLPNVADPITPMLSIRDEDYVRKQVEHLLALGHRRIAYLHAVEPDTFARPINLRRDAFYRLVIEKRLAIEPDWVRYVGWEPQRIRDEVGNLLAQTPSPTAFITTDRAASAVYAAIREAGLTPGADVSVVGGDDLPWAEHLDPPLTTIRVDCEQAAKQAVAMLDDIQLGQTPTTAYLDTPLIERQSTAPAKDD